MDITSFLFLDEFLAGLPEGTTCNILSSDLEAGNFDQAHFEKPDGSSIDILYSGEVAEGYVSPFAALFEE